MKIIHSIGPDDLSITIPIDITRQDVEKRSWPTVRQALLDYVRDSYDRVLGEEMQKRGWIK